MNSKVIEYYTSAFNEHERQHDGFGAIQRTRTLQLLKQFLNTNQKVLDIGGAVGNYSFELAKEGYDVHLLDIVHLHVEKARKISKECGIALSGFHVGDARELEFEDQSFDAAILHGPLYHITDKSERSKVLSEVYRILCDGGILLAFAINRYAGVHYGINTEQILDDDYFEMISNEITTGFRSREPGWHFHLPDELKQELIDSDFNKLQTKGVVSSIWMIPDLESKLSDPAIYRKIIRVSELLEDEPILGQDFVCIGYK